MGELQALSTERFDGSGGQARLSKRAEQFPHDVLHTSIWIHTHASRTVINKSDGQAHLQLPTTRFVEDAAAKSRPHHV
jgi:hypothetical protein